MSPPVPIPHRMRPPEMSSSESRSRRNVTGWRKFGDVTNVPRRMRSVTIAAAVSVDTVPYHGESGRPPHVRWS